MVTSRPVPQQTAQIFSPLAGQNRSGLRFSQIGQDTNSPRNIRTIQQNTRWGDKRQKRGTKTQAMMTLFWKRRLDMISRKLTVNRRAPPSSQRGLGVAAWGITPRPMLEK